MNEVLLASSGPEQRASSHELLAVLASMGTKAQGTLLSSAARTTTTISATLTMAGGYRGVLLIIDVSVASGTGGLQTVLVLEDPVSGNHIAPALPVAVTAVGRWGYLYYPGATNGTNGTIISNNIPLATRRWLGQVTHGDASSYTYTLSYTLLP